VREAVVDLERSPRAVDEQPDAILALDRRRLVDQEVGDQLGLAGDDGQRGKEPAVTHAALPHRLWPEAVAAHHDVARLGPEPQPD